MEEEMRTRSVRATTDERTRVLPGDELIPEPLESLTHAVTVFRSRTEIWPWLVQMGAGTRAGWYSYDMIDNRCVPSADRIVPRLQEISVGALFPASPGSTDGFRVAQFQLERSLVLSFASEPGAQPVVTWTFMLDAIDESTTRLIARARGSRDYPFYGLPPLVGRPFIRIGHFVMQRKQLLGIARRAESLPPARKAKKEAA
jgi:hypothetical protein